jgi:uncharacterized membrane protein
MRAKSEELSLLGAWSLELGAETEMSTAMLFIAVCCCLLTLFLAGLLQNHHLTLTLP